MIQKKQKARAAQRKAKIERIRKARQQRLSGGKPKRRRSRREIPKRRRSRR